MDTQIDQSIIIPTCNRANLLPRAILSAIECDQHRTEVIVVPNGDFSDWKSVSSLFNGDSRVRFLPIPSRHACIARNAGLQVARGKAIRFLDDDDVLFPEGACRQLVELLESGADVCSGSIVSMNENGNRLTAFPQPQTDDFVSATLAPWRATFTHAHLYLSSAIREHRWNERLPVGQDVEWMMRLCASRELAWKRLDAEVGAWIHHRGERIYRGRNPGSRAIKRQAVMILDAAEALSAQGRLNAERRAAAADGLWGCFQKGLVHEPRFWLDIAASAHNLAAGRHPPSAIYEFPGISRVDPRVVEIILTPIRALHTLVHRIAGALRRAKP